MPNLPACLDISRPRLVPDTRTARQIIEARLGRPLGPLATMPRGDRIAVKNLAIQLVKVKAARHA